MATSAAATPEAYLADLPPERRDALGAVRAMILKHLPKGYRESVNWGMLSYEVPLERYPDTYNGRPLCYVALASQKHYCSVYLMGVYQDPAQETELKAAFKREGKRLDMGKSCVRFKRAEDLPLDAIGKLIAAVTPEALIERSKSLGR
jgi:hypothetical protein